MGVSLVKMENTLIQIAIENTREGEKNNLNEVLLKDSKKIHSKRQGARDREEIVERKTDEQINSKTAYKL